MSDLLRLLRLGATTDAARGIVPPGCPLLSELLTAAADEIERLREELKRAERLADSYMLEGHEYV